MAVKPGVNGAHALCVIESGWRETGTGDWKVPRTRRLESLRHGVARAFLSAGSGELASRQFDPSVHVAPPDIQNVFGGIFPHFQD